MTKSFLLLCLILLASCATKEEQAVDYMNYHQEIQKAEEFIANEDYQEALVIYTSLSEEYDFVFKRDRETAKQLAVKLKQEAPIFPEQAIDSSLREEIEGMIAEDQRLAKVVAFMEDESEQEAFLLDSFAPHSERQVRKLIEILKRHPYPGEKAIGNDFWVSTIVSHHNSISVEQVKNDTLFDFLKPRFKEAIKKGEMSPYELALMEDWRIAVLTEGTYSGYGYLNGPIKDSIARINAKRKAVGLRPVELRNRLVDIVQKTGMDFQLPDWVEGKIEIRE